MCIYIYIYIYIIYIYIHTYANLSRSIYVYAYITKVGGVKASAAPTGKSFRIVRTRARTRAADVLGEVVFAGKMHVLCLV